MTLLGSWTDAASGATDLVQALAIVIGGLWAYFKFVRGRTLAYRGQLQIEARTVASGTAVVLVAEVAFQNTGGSQIPLSPDAKVVQVWELAPSALRPGRRADWGEPVAIAPVFESHAWVEPQEPIRETVLLPVQKPSTDPVFAYRIEALVGSGRRRGKAIKWSAEALLL